MTPLSQRLRQAFKSTDPHLRLALLFSDVYFGKSMPRWVPTPRRKTHLPLGLMK